MVDMGMLYSNLTGSFWRDTVFESPRSEPRADFLLVSWVDLLPYAPHHAHGCSHGTRYSQHDEPSQLSGMSGVLPPPLYIQTLKF
jgi:hypothetical protein